MTAMLQWTDIGYSVSFYIVFKIRAMHAVMFHKHSDSEIKSLTSCKC